MDLVKVLEDMMLVGSIWILYLLIVLSVITLAIALERYFYMRRTRTNFKEFCLWLSRELSANNFSAIEAKCKNSRSPECALVMEALTHRQFGAESLEYHLKPVITALKQDMDRGLLFLGTVGSNAPFIGLLGTVFGVIEAFHQLSITGAGASNAVMAGISEALVATGIGLLVAIPAVVLFNAFQRAVKNRVANLESLRDLILSHTKRIQNAIKVA